MHVIVVSPLVLRLLWTNSFRFALLGCHALFPGYLVLKRLLRFMLLEVQHPGMYPQGTFRGTLLVG